MHVCHREAEPQPGEREEQASVDGSRTARVTGGLIKRASPAMIHTYFDYMMAERRRLAG